jgi:hypothetical protein
MNWITRRLPVLLCALAVMGVVSACGGSSSTPNAASSGTASAASSAGAAPSASAGSTQGFCGVVAQQKAVLMGTEMSNLLTNGTPAAWQAYLAEAATMNQQLVDAAPPEIQDSVKTLQAATLDLKSAMEANGYDVSKMGSAQLVQLLNTPQRKAAIAALVTYVKTNCGIDLSTA